MHSDTSTPTTGAIAKLAWPLTLKAIMTHGIIVIDAWLVADLGEEALAAMGLAGSLAGLLLGILFSFSTATQIRVAQAFGSGKAIALKTAFHSGLIINIGAGFLGLLVVFLFGDNILNSVAHSPDIAAQAQRYLYVFAIVVLGESVGQSIASYFNGCGETKTPFYSYLIAVPTNIALSIVLIHGLYGFPELGLVGAAAGSAVGSMMRALYLCVRFYQEKRSSIAVAGWSHDTIFTSIKRHLLFSLPIAATFISATLANSVATLIYASLSIYQFAAMTLIMPWVQVAGTVGMMWAQASGIIIAQLLGKTTPSDALDEFLGRAWRASFIASGLVAVIYLAVDLSSPWIYADLQQETKTALLSFLPVLLFLPFPKGSNAMCGHTLRAGGDTVYVMNIFIASQWLFRIPATAFMVLYLDLSVTWVFSLLLLEELVKFPAFHLRIRKGAWKHNL